MTSARAERVLEAKLVAEILWPSTWAESHRVIRDEAGRSRLYSFHGRHFLRAIHDDLAPRIVLKKGPQVGATEVAINRVFWWLSTSSRDVLYVMPTDRDVSVFSAGRFAHSLAVSEAVSGLFSEVSNVSHKRARSGANLYLRGAMSPSGLKSIPVAGLVLDEFDEMTPLAVDLARDRLSGQENWWEFDLSTPTLPGFGVDREYAASDRRRWHVPCHLCGGSSPLEWPSSLSGEFAGDPRSARWVCGVCGETWTESEKRANVDRGAWVAEDPGATIRGYHLPQLLSPVRTAADHAFRWAHAQGDPARLRGFWATMAECHVGEGARFDTAMFEDARRSGPGAEPPLPREGDRIAAGVDAGVNRHYVEVARWEGDRKTVLLARVATSYDEVEALLRRYHAQAAVFDANPNTERARELQRRLNSEQGRAVVWLAFYGGDEMKVPIRWHGETGTVTARRTELLDEVYARYSSRRVGLPKDLPPEYEQHFGALSRVEERDESKGNVRARWVDSGPDHFAHAAAYCEVAAKLVPEVPTRVEWREDRDPLLPAVRYDADGWPREVPRLIRF